MRITRKQGVKIGHCISPIYKIIHHLELNVIGCRTDEIVECHQGTSVLCCMRYFYVSSECNVDRSAYENAWGVYVLWSTE